jgi:hypothetical protein
MTPVLKAQPRQDELSFTAKAARALIGLPIGLHKGGSVEHSARTEAMP